MKESIFFNRKQLGIIRRYLKFYRMLFDYGVWVFSGLISLILLIGLLLSSPFGYAMEGDLSLLEETKELLERQNNIDRIKVSSFSGVELVALGGTIGTDNSGLISMDNVLKLGENLILPRYSFLSIGNLEKYGAISSGVRYQDQDFSSFFNDVLIKPIKEKKWETMHYQKFLMTGDIEQFFGLDCVKGASAKSFVCDQRIRNFISHFSSLDFEKASFLIWQLDPMDNISMDSNRSLIKKQLDVLYPTFRKSHSAMQLFCKEMVDYVQFGGQVDTKITEMMFACDLDSYKQFQKLKELRDINAGLSNGVPDAKFSFDKDFNHYKLYSLQQMMYKQIMAATEVETYVSAYTDFLTNILMKETENGNQLLNSFARQFTSWFNRTVLLPYLRGNSAKVSAEQKNNLIAKLLVIGNGDKNDLFKGIDQDQELVSLETGNVIEVEQKIDLEKLFRDNTPVQFLMTKNHQEADLLFVEGEDQLTNVRFSAEMKFDGVKLYVIRIGVPGNVELEEFVNALLKTDTYSFVKLLGLFKDNLEIAQQKQSLKVDLCGLVKQKYGEQVNLCSPTKLEIEKGGVQEGSGIIYHFGIKDGVLVSFSLANKGLESQILELLDFSKLNKDNTFSTIEKVLSYEKKEENSGFGAKNQLLINDMFLKYFKKKPTKVDVVGESIKVYFEVKEIPFIGEYDVARNRLERIALDFGDKRRPVIVQRLEFDFNTLKSDQMNAFLLDPVSYLRKLNSRLVDMYFKDGKLHFEAKSDQKTE